MFIEVLLISETSPVLKNSWLRACCCISFLTISTRKCCIFIYSFLFIVSFFQIFKTLFPFTYIWKKNELISNWYNPLLLNGNVCIAWYGGCVLRCFMCCVNTFTFFIIFLPYRRTIELEVLRTWIEGGAQSIFPRWNKIKISLFTRFS